MAHSTSSPELPSVFQPATSSASAAVWRPQPESFNIVKTGRAPGGGFTVYRIIFKVWTETAERGPVIQECEIWKRYSDFQNLSKQLELIHSRSTLVTPFPSIVKAKYFERFKESVIEERKKSAEALLYFASYYQHLAESQPLRQFLSGAKIVGRLAADSSVVMAGSVPLVSPTMAIPSYPNIGDLEPTVSDKHQQLDTTGEEELAAGSSLNAHKMSAPPHEVDAKSGESRTLAGSKCIDNGRGDKERTISNESERAPGQIQQDLLVPQISESQEHLSAGSGEGGGSVNSGASSVTESWEDLEVKTNSVIHQSGSHVSLDNVELDVSTQEIVEGTVCDLDMELGSVHVSEWNLAHSLKLRDMDVQPDMIGKSETSEDESESDSNKQRGRNKRSRESDQSDSSSSKPNSPSPCQYISVPGQPSSTLSPIGSQSEMVERMSGAEGMDWWKEAMAKTQNVTDDIDSLVEQQDTREINGTKRVAGDDGNSRLKISIPFSLQSHSSSAIHDEPSKKKDTSSKSVLSHSTDCVMDLDVAALNDQENKLSRERIKELRCDASHSSPDLINSARGRSKTSSHQNSRSRSPSHHRGSPISEAKGLYVVQAGRLIKQALSYEQNAEYQEAFDLFKAGVDVLLNGVQTDQNKQRREVVRKKTAEYLKHAEELFQNHLSPSLKEDKKKVDGLEPLSPPSEAKPHLLPDFKVIGIIGKVILVESRHTGQRYIFKVLYKSLQAMAAVGKGKSKATTNRTPHHCPHMVRLLHHYETSTHRIFLLLEYVRGGRLLDFVNRKREQWKKLHDAVTNPPPSSSLILSDTIQEACGNSESSLVLRDTRTAAQASGEDDTTEDDIEQMLGELASIVPPSSLPDTDSVNSDYEQYTEEGVEGSKDADSEPSVSVDRLALLRKRLEESAEPEELDFIATTTTAATTTRETDHLTLAVSSEAVDSKQDDETTATINILPATPTVPGGFDHHHGTSVSEEERASGVNDKNSLSVEDTMTPRRSLPRDIDSLSNEEIVSVSVTVPCDGDGSHSDGSSRHGSTCFSPGSMHNSPSTTTKADDWILRLEDEVRMWAAQIIVAVDHLHNCGIICRDLNPSNILINNSRSAVLTYFGKWDFVESDINYKLARKLYVAPELCGLSEVHPSADWWSLGAILFEILTGKTLASCHPDGVHSHLNLRVPVNFSPEAYSLLSQLLQVSPNERLGAGLTGVEELKAHPFFASVDWNSV